MKNLLQGLHHFRSGMFVKERELFTKLVEGQNPSTLFISCSDSRVMPALITQAGPGDLFELRNAGNMVPPFGASNGGESATIEFAVAGLGVKDIVICGHTHCGALKGLLNMTNCESMPLVRQWLQHAETTRRIMDENYSNLPPEHRLNVAVQEHVLVQVENIQTHPAVAVKLQRGEIHIHAWVYKLESGDVFSYSPEAGRFVPLTLEATPTTNTAQERMARPEAATV
jgi:carbonic anhydrase